MSPPRPSAHSVINRLRKQLRNLALDSSLRSFTSLPQMDFGFFPGGNGLYEGRTADTFPVGGTIVLGSDFGCYDGFVNGNKRLRTHDERGGRTWRPLLERLCRAGFKQEECFFTNAWPVLHLGQTNRAPVAKFLKSEPLMASCLHFFKQTVRAIRPTTIVALGTGPAAFLARWAPRELGCWAARSFKAIDKSPLARVRVGESTITCVAITHPCMRNARSRERQYRGANGEVRLLARARRMG